MRNKRAKLLRKLKRHMLDTTQDKEHMLKIIGTDKNWKRKCKPLQIPAIRFLLDQ